jgi:hypothetical protein
MKSFPRISLTATLPVLLIATLLLLQSPPFGQATTGSVTGIVADSTGALIPNAEVQNANLGTLNSYSFGKVQSEI